MGIYSINQAMSASSYGAYTQKLTEATKAKLEELGIAYNQNMSESEGKKLIREAELKKSQTENQQQNFNQSQQDKSDLFKKALSLAEKLGVNVPEDASFEKLISILEQALEVRVNQANGDYEQLQKLQNYSRELASIQAQSKGGSGYDSTNEALMKSLEMLSQYNRNFLNK